MDNKRTAVRSFDLSGRAALLHCRGNIQFAAAADNRLSRFVGDAVFPCWV